MCIHLYIIICVFVYIYQPFHACHNVTFVIFYIYLVGDYKRIGDYNFIPTYCKGLVGQVCVML